MIELKILFISSLNKEGRERREKRKEKSYPERWDNEIT